MSYTVKKANELWLDKWGSTANIGEITQLTKLIHDQSTQLQPGLSSVTDQINIFTILADCYQKLFYKTAIIAALELSFQTDQRRTIMIKVVDNLTHPKPYNTNNQYFRLKAAGRRVDECARHGDISGLHMSLIVLQDSFTRIMHEQDSIRLALQVLGRDIPVMPLEQLL